MCNRLILIVLGLHYLSNVLVANIFSDECPNGFIKFIKMCIPDEDDYPDQRFMNQRRLVQRFYSQYSRTVCQLLASEAQSKPRPNKIELLWSGDLEQAAAALLRANLLAAGHDPTLVKLQKVSEASLYGDVDTLTVRIILAVKLHVRLTTGASTAPACRNASSWSFYQDPSTLMVCGILKDTNDSLHVYLPEELDRELVTEQIIEIMNMNRSTCLNVKYYERNRLKNDIVNSNHSFLFIDAGCWDKPEVKVVSLTVNGRLHQSNATNLDKVVTLKSYGDVPLNLNEIFDQFSPNHSDLDHVLSGKFISIEENACEMLRGSYHEQTLKPSSESVALSALNDQSGQVVVVICNEDSNSDEYSNLVEIMQRLNFFPPSIQFRTHYIRCFDSGWLLQMLIYWSSEKMVLQIKGVVLSDPLELSSGAVGPLAEALGIPLVAYDVSDERLAVYAGTGRLTQLQLALNRLLAACGWRRLATLSERSQLAHYLVANLRVSDERLLLRNLVADSEPEIVEALKTLRKEDARVILVNGNTRFTAKVLDIALEWNMTRAAGFEWIVREYDGGATIRAVVALSPLSVSFWWRGEEAEAPTAELSRVAEVRAQLEQRWQDRAWPARAASLFDALLTLAENIKVDPRKRRTLSKNLINATISGLVQNLTFDEHGVKHAHVFIERWGAGPRPARLATWQALRRRKRCPVPDAQHDGSLHCYMPRGALFHPTCEDALWISSGVVATCVLVTTVVAVTYGTRRALAARKHRIQLEYAARLLARRELAFSALSTHLVERSALEPLGDLGSGHFGRVRLATLRARGHPARLVAVKTLREDAAPAEETEFLREACTLAPLRHEHVVRFVGVCVVDGPPLLLMEHALHGDLHAYLRRRRFPAEDERGAEERRRVSAEQLTRLAREAAAALAYLASRGLVHRDVRAANCLLDERHALKLADFGLARPVSAADGEYTSRRRGLFPVPWMAPESVALGAFSLASDVWSFGVLVFELITLGRRPHGALPAPHVLRLVEAGGRPRLPWDAAADTRTLVRACWRPAAEDRPAAARLERWLAARPRALRPARAEHLLDVDEGPCGERERDDLHDLDLGAPSALRTSPALASAGV